MTGRDFGWRALGAALVVGSYVLLALAPPDVGTAIALIGFAAAIAGVVLLVQGKRVAAALRVERGRHRELPRAVHARHRVRRMRH